MNRVADINHGFVDDTTALSAVTDYNTDGLGIFVKSENTVYHYDPEATEGVKPDAVSPDDPGRWVAMQSGYEPDEVTIGLNEEDKLECLLNVPDPDEVTIGINEEGKLASLVPPDDITIEFSNGYLRSKAWQYPVDSMFNNNVGEIPPVGYFRFIDIAGAHANKIVTYYNGQLVGRFTPFQGMCISVLTTTWPGALSSGLFIYAHSSEPPYPLMWRSLGSGSDGSSSGSGMAIFSVTIPIGGTVGTSEAQPSAGGYTPISIVPVISDRGVRSVTVSEGGVCTVTLVASTAIGCTYTVLAMGGAD
jgi:hypothetical protein